MYGAELWIALCRVSEEKLQASKRIRGTSREPSLLLYKHWVKRNFQTESQFPSPSEGLGMLQLKFCHDGMLEDTLRLYERARSCFVEGLVRMRRTRLELFVSGSGGETWASKFIQVLPKQTRTEIALGLLGSNPIIAEIDKNKLIFLGQLCRLPPEVIHKQIFNQRLLSVFHTPVLFSESAIF